jgi:hypothetical protein
MNEGHGFRRVSMRLRLTQGDENHGEFVFDCAAQLAVMRALASEVRLSPSSAAKTAAERDDVAPYVSKSVPQRLKPSWEGLLWHG